MDSEKRDQEKRRNRLKTTLTSRLFPDFLQDVGRQKAMILVVTSMIIAAMISPSFTVINPTFRLGEVADRNIKAKRDFLIEDEEATSKKREEVVRQVPIVADFDENVSRHVLERLAVAFDSMRQTLAETRTDTGGTKGIQLRAYPSFSDTTAPASYLSSDMLHSLDLSTQFSNIASAQKKDLETFLGIQVPDEIHASLLDEKFSRELEGKISGLLKAAFEEGIVAGKAWLLQAQGAGLIVRKLGTQEENLITPPYSYEDLEEMRKITRMRAMEQGKDVKEMLAISFLVGQLLRPNLTFNLEETGKRREQAYASVSPVFIKLKKNEMLVREGQRIGPEEMVRLKVHEQGNPERSWLLVFMTLLFFCGISIYVVVRVSSEHFPSFFMDVEDLVFLGMLMIFLLGLARCTIGIADIVGDGSFGLTGRTLIYAIPLSAGAMISCIFFGVTVSLIFSILTTLFAGMLFGKDFALFVYFLIGSFVAAHGVSRCRNRMIPIKAGLLVGGVNAIIIILGGFIQEQPIFLKLLVDASFGLCGGLFAGILVTGFCPLVEMAFGYTTDMRLLELATMDQPLLQQLMVEAPGTYHHSIIVGNMVEAAAKSIGANSLLAKVAAYYHDIGKIRKPLYFIENQFDCENRHEKLAPSMSSLILIKHVKEGVELAKQHRLGKEIIDIIQQHHGKSFISFFYNKAMEAREKAQNTKGSVLPPVTPDDYRYPGPKPQTKEAGLVMLADVVEAACRSLTEPTPARIQGLVNRLINNIFSDGQLEECELTLKDLHHIAKHFNQILATVHHKRIEYPNKEDGKTKADASADPSQRESKPDRDRPGANRESGKPDLKRLGIH